MILDGSYIVAVTKNDSLYEAVTTAIKHKPIDPNGYYYRLNVTTLEWELVELPPEPEPDPEAEIYDYEQELADLGVRFE